MEDVPKYTGFRSIVAYPEDVAEYINAQGNTRGLRGLSVYADTLFMDFDDHDPVEFRKWLQDESGLDYTEWDSGNRSVHFHIALEPIEGPWVPQALKNWTKKHAPSADMSFLHACGAYRLPGTFHPKNPGKFKRKVDERTGYKLQLEPVKSVTPKAGVVLSDSVTKAEVFSIATQATSTGNRRPHAWRLASLGFEAGMTYEEVSATVLSWNKNFANPPHPDDLILKQVEFAYNRLLRRDANVGQGDPIRETETG